MRRRPKKPVGTPGRWREGKAERLGREALDRLIKDTEREVARKIAAQLRDHDVPLNEASEALGVTPAALFMWSSGQRVASLGVLRGIARVLRVPLADLLPDDFNLMGDRR